MDTLHFHHSTDAKQEKELDYVCACCEKHYDCLQCFQHHVLATAQRPNKQYVLKTMKLLRENNEEIKRFKTILWEQYTAKRKIEETANNLVAITLRIKEAAITEQQAFVQALSQAKDALLKTKVELLKSLATGTKVALPYSAFENAKSCLVKRKDSLLPNLLSGQFGEYGLQMKKIIDMIEESKDYKSPSADSDTVSSSRLGINRLSAQGFFEIAQAAKFAGISRVPRERYRMVVTSEGTYYIGGQIGTRAVGNCDKTLPRTTKLYRIASLLEPRYNHTAIVVAHRIYCCGGVGKTGNWALPLEYLDQLDEEQGWNLVPIASSAISCVSEFCCAFDVSYMQFMILGQYYNYTIHALVLCSP